MCLLYRERFLFTHRRPAWNPSRKRLVAWGDVCWYDWNEQTEPMGPLARHRFEWCCRGTDGA
jgi:hypothetical protein